MKKIFSLSLLLFAANLFAQNDIKQNIKEKSQSDKDRIILQFTMDNWLTKPDSITTKWFSRGIGLYWMITDVPLGKSRLSFSFGVGVTSSNIYHNTLIKQTDTVTVFSPSDMKSSIFSDYKRNKLVTAYLDVPVEFRYRSKPDKTNNSWKIAIGFKGGMLVGNHSKLKAKDPVLGDLTVYKESGIKHLNKYRYGPTLKLGYGSFNIVAYYSLSTLFDTKGPEIVPYSIGILLSEF